MPSVLSRGYFHRRPSERWMLMCLPKSSSTRASAMSLPHNTPTQGGIQRRVMRIRLSLRSLEKCILAPKSLGATSLPVRLFEMKELMSILVTIYLLGMLFLPVSSYLAQTTSAMAIFHRNSCRAAAQSRAGHQSLHLPVLRLRVDELVPVTRLEHIIRALCSFRLHGP
jgi:hypothetical protein